MTEMEKIIKRLESVKNIHRIYTATLMALVDGREVEVITIAIYKDKRYDKDR